MEIKIESSGEAESLYVDTNHKSGMIELSQEWQLLFIDKSQAAKLAEALQKCLAGEEVE